jgi:hypothetical protein
MKRDTSENIREIPASSVFNVFQHLRVCPSPKQFQSNIVAEDIQSLQWRHLSGVAKVLGGEVSFVFRLGVIYNFFLTFCLSF